MKSFILKYDSYIKRYVANSYLSSTGCIIEHTASKFLNVANV